MLDRRAWAARAHAAFTAACEARGRRPVKPVERPGHREDRGRTGGTERHDELGAGRSTRPQFQADHHGGADYVDIDDINEARANSPYSGRRPHRTATTTPLFGEDPELQPFWDIYVEKSGEMLDWLVSHGFYFGNEPTGDFYATSACTANYEYAGTMGDQCKMEVKGYFDKMIATTRWRWAAST